MLFTRSNAARANLERYILSAWDNDGLSVHYDFTDAALDILRTFRVEQPAVGSYVNMTEQERFEIWCQGLPSKLDTCYYYNRLAVDDLALILEETETERETYRRTHGESKAEHVLTCLLYRTLLQAERRAQKAADAAGIQRVYPCIPVEY